MNDCGDHSGAIRLYLDGDTGDPCVIALRAHLEECPACRQVLEAEEELSGLLRRAQPLYSVPEGLQERLLNMLPKQA